MTPTSRAVVVAVDGGGSKTDAAVVDLVTGRVLGQARGPGCSHHAVGIPTAVRVVDSMVSSALVAAGASAADVVHAGCYLTAIDMPSEQLDVHAALSASAWAGQSLHVGNDVFALLRAGTDAGDAAVVVCGTGINGAAVRADGATSRILALGQVSGDWGGASGIAEEVLWHAARDEDGRGEPTQLRETLLTWTRRDSVHDVILDVHEGRLMVSEWWARTPEVFALAAAGDAVSAALVDRQGREIGVLAASLLAKLELQQAAVPVVLGGGIGASGDPLLVNAVRRTLDERAPRARLVIVSAAPITGAVQLARAAALRLAS